MKYTVNFHKPMYKCSLGLSRPILFADVKEKNMYYFHGFLESLPLYIKMFGVIVESLCRREPV